MTHPLAHLYDDGRVPFEVALRFESDPRGAWREARREIKAGWPFARPLLREEHVHRDPATGLLHFHRAARDLGRASRHQALIDILAWRDQWRDVTGNEIGGQNVLCHLLERVVLP